MCEYGTEYKSKRENKCRPLSSIIILQHYVKPDVIPKCVSRFLPKFSPFSIPEVCTTV